MALGITNHRGGMVDADLVLRDGSSDLTGDENNQAFTLHTGNPIQHQMALYVLVPEVSSSDSLVVTARCTTTGEKVEITHTDAIDGNTTLPFILCLPLPPSRGTAWEYDLNTSGSGIDFGAVEVWVGLADNAKVDA